MQTVAITGHDESDVLLFLRDCHCCKRGPNLVKAATVPSLTEANGLAGRCVRLVFCGKRFFYGTVPPRLRQDMSNETVQGRVTPHRRPDKMRIT
jgi:hypothetical protein